MSNASEIRMYFKELLGDSMEHSRSELFAYAKEQNPGAHFTEGMLTGALKTLVDANEGYSCVSRGVYKFNAGANVTDRSYIRILVGKYREILKAAIEKIENDITVNPFLLLEAEESELAEMRKIQRCIDTMKATIESVNE